MSAKFPRGGEQTHSQPSVYIHVYVHVANDIGALIWHLADVHICCLHISMVKTSLLMKRLQQIKANIRCCMHIAQFAKIKTIFRDIIHHNLSQCMRFQTMWYVQPAKPQISLHIRAV